MGQKLEKELVKRAIPHDRSTWMGHHDHRINRKWDPDSDEARDPTEPISGHLIDEEIDRLNAAASRKVGAERLMLWNQAGTLKRDAEGVGRKTPKDIVLPLDKKQKGK